MDFGVWLSSIPRGRSCACKSDATSMYTEARQFLWDLIDEVVITSSRSERGREKMKERERERGREELRRGRRGRRRGERRREKDSEKFYFIGE